MPFPGFCVPLNPIPSFTGLTVAAGGLGGMGAQTSPCLYPDGLLLLTSRPCCWPQPPHWSLLHSWGPGVAPWNQTSDPVPPRLPLMSELQFYIAQVPSSGAPDVRVCILGQLSDLGSAWQISGAGWEVAYIISLHFLIPAPAFPDTFICKLWSGKLRSDYIQMFREKTVVSLLTDDWSDFPRKLPTLLGRNGGWINLVQFDQLFHIRDSLFR